MGGPKKATGRWGGQFFKKELNSWILLNLFFGGDVLRLFGLHVGTLIHYVFKLGSLAFSPNPEGKEDYWSLDRKVTWTEVEDHWGAEPKGVRHCAPSVHGRLWCHQIPWMGWNPVATIWAANQFAMFAVYRSGKVCWASGAQRRVPASQGQWLCNFKCLCCVNKQRLFGLRCTHILKPWN